jgi:hypothetical protein
MSESSFIYGVILFTSTNIIYSFMNKIIKNNDINEIKNILHINNTNLMRELYTIYDNIVIINNNIDFIKNNINSINITRDVICQNKNDIYNMISNLNNKINNIDEKFNNLIDYNNTLKIDKNDKYTSTDNLSIFTSKENNNKSIQNDTIFIESDQDLIDDVYDYLPCQNYKKHTVYDIIINNLSK